MKQEETDDEAKEPLSLAQEFDLGFGVQFGAWASGV